MASIGQIIFWSMIVLIFVMAGFIIFLLAIAFSVSQGTVRTNADFPVGNLGQDAVLDCTFQTHTQKAPSDSLLITWTKEGLNGVVYQYHNNAPQLKDQNSQFRNRVQLFPDVTANGNASLFLRRVMMEDEGTYRCSVTAPGVSGTVSVPFHVGVFSAPTFTTSNNTLVANAPRWWPLPNVMWFRQGGKQLNSTTECINSSDSVQVVSTLNYLVSKEEKYTCIIQNIPVKAVSEVTGEGILASTHFFYNSSPKTLPLRPFGVASILLFMLACEVISVPGLLWAYTMLVMSNLLYLSIFQ